MRRNDKCLLAVLLLVWMATGVAQGQESATRMTSVQRTTTSIDPGTSDLWKESPDSEHHKAVLKVENPQGFGGTGSVIKVDSPSDLIVVTNAHVVEICDQAGNGLGRYHRVVSITARGDRVPMNVVKVLPEQDVAILHKEGWTSPDSLEVLETFPASSAVEVAGFGGGVFRHFWGNPIQTSGSIKIDASLISGDSGSPMLVDGAIVGVARGGDRWTQTTRDSRGGQWTLTYPATSDIDTPTLCRTLVQVCNQYGCQPIIRRPVIRRSQVYVQPTPQVQPVESAQCPPGPAGPQGPPGKDGQDGTVSPEQIESIVARVTGALRGDPSLRGSAGPPGQSAEIDYDRLAENVASRLPPISLALVGPDGTELDKDTVPLGGTLKLQFYERDANATR